MRLKSMLFVAAAVSVLTVPAEAGWLAGLTGNDSGGIISWSPEVQRAYPQMAAEHCARWNKVAVITSVHPWYGDFIGFECRWPRGYDPAKEGWGALRVRG